MTKVSDQSTKKLGFTKALNRLEEIVQRLEDIDLELEQGLKLLEEGAHLHKYCKKKLTEANSKIQNILQE